MRTSGAEIRWKIVTASALSRLASPGRSPRGPNRGAGGCGGEAKRAFEGDDADEEIDVATIEAARRGR